MPLYVNGQVGEFAGENKLEVEELLFRGNSSFDKDLLTDIIRTKETPGGVSQFFYRTLGDKFGGKPEYFDPVTSDEDVELLGEFYKRNGFFNTQISTSVSVDSLDSTVTLLYSIVEGKQSFIDSVYYGGCDSLSVNLRTLLFKDPLITRGIAYVDSKVSGEVYRLLDILANNGYPTAKLDEEKSGAFRFLSSDNFLIRLVFVPGALYRFGEITVATDPPRSDITDNLSLRHLDFTAGEIYSNEKIVSSERNLNRLGLFETARIDHPITPDSSQGGIVPIEIRLRPRTRNELSPELIVSDEGGFFNIGTGVEYTNRNFFGDARTFTAHTRIRTQDIHRWSFRNVFQGKGLRDNSVKGAVELQLQVIQPYLFSRKLSGSWTSTIGVEKQETYILSILRNKIGLSNRFAAYTYGFFDWTLERVSPEILQDTLATQALLNILRQEDQRQFNSILTLTMQRDKTNDFFSPTAGFFHSISLEESGILPMLLRNDRTELPFTQYYKITLLGRWYKDLTTRRFNIMAWKLKTGYQDKYGESKRTPVSIPLNRRFFGGGSGSVRGWSARTLGAMSDERIQFGGNFVFEGSLEMRVSHFGGYGQLGFIKLENIVGVYFLDFGNVWSDIKDVRIRDVAVAAGIGIRYETFFGPFRIDYGIRLYDPKGIDGRYTVFQKRLIGEVLGRGVFHFGIGHAF